jgi:hypothetical protein
LSSIACKTIEDNRSTIFRQPQNAPSISILRIQFICSGLESGKDGVGDYTRRLAGACTRMGHPCQMLSLNDKYASPTQAAIEYQVDGETKIPTLRLSADTSWHQRETSARSFTRNFVPDFMSLQFVPYGFHPKGLPLGLSKRLNRIGMNTTWHLMFHELWIGSIGSGPWKKRIVGALQKRVVANLLSTLNPPIVHTQATPYVRLLKLLSSRVSQLPLFGNFDTQLGNADNGWEKLKQLLGTSDAPRIRAQHHIAGVFGSVHPEWDPSDFVNRWSQCCKEVGKCPLLVFLGKGVVSTPNNEPQLNNGHAHSRTEFGSHQAMIDELRSKVPVIVLGEHSDEHVASFLKSFDFVISTTPAILSEKSSSSSSCLDFGLPVVVTRESQSESSIELDGFHLASQLDSKEMMALSRGLERPNRLNEIADQFIASLKPAH